MAPRTPRETDAGTPETLSLCSLAYLFFLEPHAICRAESATCKINALRLLYQLQHNLAFQLCFHRNVAPRLQSLFFSLLFSERTSKPTYVLCMQHSSVRSEAQLGKGHIAYLK